MGAALAAGTGTAAGTSTVTGVALAAGVGTAAGTSTATGVGSALAAGVGTAAGTSTCVGTTSNIFPLTVSADGRYLKQSDGTPFLICGDSTWEIGVNIPLADVDTFLNTLVSQSMNAVLMEAIEHNFTVVKPPKERGGLLPFTQRLDGATYTGSPNGTNSASGTQDQFSADAYSNIGTQCPDWTFVNNSYWQAIETVLNSCLSHSLLVFVWPGYLGFHGGDEGWLSEMVALDAVTGAGGFTGQSFANGSKSKLWNYGAWLAARWKTYPNLVWVMGGDYGSGSQQLTTPEANAVSNLMDGLKSVAGQASVLFSAHWDRTGISTDTVVAAGSFNANYCYCDDAVAEICRRAYAVTPAIPAYLGEGWYEDTTFGGTVPYRRYLYWAFLGGIAGGFYGHEQLWRFDDGTPGTDYTTLLATQARLDAQRQFAFWKARPWQRLRPNGLNSIGTLVTAGGGTASPQSTDYVAAAATPEGDLLLAYVPPAHTGSITIDMTKLAAMIVARWFDPTNATYTSIGAFANTGTHAFTTTGNNNAGDADWLLVLETAVATAAGTSTVTGVGQSTAAGAGSSAGVATATGVGQSTAASVGTSAGTSTATGVGLALSAAVGTAAGTSTATAVGSPLASGVGSSAGTSTCTAVGQATANGVGTAAGTAIATAVGQSTAQAVGTAAGTSSATGISDSSVTGVGTAAGTSTVSGVGTAIAQGVGSAAGTATASGVGAALAEATGTAAGTSTAAAVGAALAAGTGTAAGTSTAAAVGSALAQSVGTAAGTSTALAVGQAITAGSGTGDAAGTCTVVGVGQALAAGVGTAAGTSTALAVGSALSEAVGQAAGTSTATAVGAPLASAIGTAAGTSTVAGVSVIVGNVGTAAGTSTCIAVGQAIAAAVGTAAGTCSVLGISGDVDDVYHGTIPNPDVYDDTGSPANPEEVFS